MSFPLYLPVGGPSPLAIVTHPTPTLWVIEFRNGIDNRITTHVILDVFMPALQAVEESWRAARQKEDLEDTGRWTPGALVLTGNLDQNKFFSNGVL